MEKRVIAVYGKNIEEGSAPLAAAILGQLREAGIALVCEEAFAERLRTFLPGADFFEGTYHTGNLPDYRPELLLSIGGDGTFLDSVLYVRESRIPILGLNTGRLGFLATISAGDADKAVRHIIGRDYAVRERRLLRLKVDGRDFPDFSYGLNEVGIHKTESSSMLKIHAYIGDAYLTTYWSDGLIVATPTGSTAYSLSGGGPIVSPECRNLILTPVCPHNLTMRTLVVPDDVEIRLKVEGRAGEFMLSLDSRVRKVGDEAEVEITAGGFTIGVVQLPGYNYYATLRNKLGWGEDKRNDRDRI